MRILTFTIAAMMVAALAGCGGDSNPQSTSVNTAPPSGGLTAEPAPMSSSAPATASGSSSGAALMGSAEAAPAASSGAEKKYEALEAKLKKTPNDAKLKAATAEAAYAAGHYIEYDKPGLSPREKYRPALKLYNRALALNPKHAKAAMEKKQIEDIYAQMGMPVPK